MLSLKVLDFHSDCYVKNGLETMGNSDGLEWREMESIGIIVGGRFNRLHDWMWSIN